MTLNLPVDDIAALGRVLTRIQDEQAQNQRLADRADDPLDLAESLYELRRFRDEVFGDFDFADPRWDMLLYLFIADANAEKTRVSEALTAAAATMTTASRHLQALVENELVVRAASDSDLRVGFVSLTDLGREKVARVLAAWRRPAVSTIG